ncbi:Exosome complex component CSL4 [Wickerhamiella sorbophila]|uniref:Exosome complex component CSL4 n=1 Tax=Wickerhamiella sorbophila TaxID=45607 RepID=A0A2T0FNM2_9ASCO|nr:Exosome complex component CSL4 [Wickerhamiella sorbophila]PRT56580.1 Exosome complex component CSL4 [Wickerhamiella sorbophila]
MLPAYVVPGQQICLLKDTEKGKTPKYVAGPGVEPTDNGYVSCLLGELKVEEVDDVKSKARHRVSVVNKYNNPYAFVETPRSNSQRNSSQLPQVGDIVYGVVTKLMPTQINVQILVVENKAALTKDNGVGWTGAAVGTVHQASGTNVDSSNLDEGYNAVIRLQDVRATERDKVKARDCFRPGDIVRASVLSLGDGNNFYLSTIQSDLGVVFAKSTSGYPLAPLDWQTMVSPVTRETEPRKCANPFQAST